MEASWNHRDKIAIFRTPIREFYNPTLDDADQFDRDGFALIHYAANSNALGPDSKLMIPSDIKTRIQHDPARRGERKFSTLGQAGQPAGSGRRH